MSKIIRIDSLHHGDKKSCSANGDGVRIVAWWCGCDIHCEGCHNKQYWDFDNCSFEDFSQEHIDTIINEVKEYGNIYSGLSILGGEPFSKRNIDDVIKLCEVFINEFPDKNIWIWSGHTLEWMLEQTDEYGDKIKKLLSMCNYLVDGPFILNKRNIGLKFRGSENQRIINLKEMSL